MRTKFLSLALATLALTATALVTGPSIGRASDHDDGELDLKGRALNLTDLYVFREDNQTGNPADKNNLILIMNSAPRALPGQQYFFSTAARYQFHMTQVTAADKTKAPTGESDIVLRFEFSPPNASQQQEIKLTVIKNGTTTVVSKNADGTPIVTTPISASKAGTPITNNLNVGNIPVSIFAGLREDPFFFDVEQFFKVREAAVKTQRFIGFLAPAVAKDFTHNYNINTIVARVPISALQTDANEPVFDTWMTISVPK